MLKCNSFALLGSPAQRRDGYLRIGFWGLKSFSNRFLIVFYPFSEIRAEAMAAAAARAVAVAVAMAAAAMFFPFFLRFFSFSTCAEPKRFFFVFWGLLPGNVLFSFST